MQPPRGLHFPLFFEKRLFLFPQQPHNHLHQPNQNHYKADDRGQPGQLPQIPPYPTEQEDGIDRESDHEQESAEGEKGFVLFIFAH